MFFDVCGERDAGGLEDAADHSGCRRPHGNGLAVLLDGRLLQAIEIIEERLPFGFEALFLASAHEFLGERQRQKRTKGMIATLHLQI